MGNTDSKSVDPFSRNSIYIEYSLLLAYDCHLTKMFYCNIANFFREGKGD